jgi:hypothetical protein
MSAKLTRESGLLSLPTESNPNLDRVIAIFQAISSRELGRGTGAASGIVSGAGAGAGAGAGMVTASASEALPEGGFGSRTWTDPSGKVFTLRNIEGKPVFIIANTAPPSEVRVDHNEIPLSIEMYFQTQRYVNGLLENAQDHPLLTAQVFSTLNDRISRDYRTYLERHPSATAPEINAFLDDNRIIYLKLMLETLHQYIQRLHPLPTFRDDWARYLTTHTAGPMTVVEENPNGSLTVMEICEQSSHSKKIAPPAIVPMKTYSPEGELQSIHFRCPSLVASKDLSVVSQIGLLMGQRSALPGFSPAPSGMTDEGSTGVGAAAGGGSVTFSPAPMVYNLLTSFVDKTADLGNNQSATAAAIFAAAHEYNRNLQATDPLFLPMNLPINQLTRDLSVDNPETMEALFLSHLAVANTTLKELAEFLGSGYGDIQAKILECIDKMNKLYSKFLSSGKTHFSAAAEREAFIEQIEFLRNTTPTLVSLIERRLQSTPEAERTPQDQAKLKLQLALTKLFYRHYSPEMSGTHDRSCPPDQKIYGALVQALHLATSTGNVVGCKSANDRFGLIWNMQASLNDPSTEFQAALDTFLSSSSPSAARIFAEAAYAHADQTTIFGAGHMPSIVDIGPPKHRVSHNPDDSLDVGGVRLFGTGLRLSGIKSFDLPPIFAHMQCKNAGKVQFHLRHGIRALFDKSSLSQLINRTFFETPPSRPALAFGLGAASAAPSLDSLGVPKERPRVESDASSTGVRPKSPAAEGPTV